MVWWYAGMMVWEEGRTRVSVHSQNVYTMVRTCAALARHLTLSLYRWGHRNLRGPGPACLRGRRVQPWLFWRHSWYSRCITHVYTIGGRALSSTVNDLFVMRAASARFVLCCALLQCLLLHVLICVEDFDRTMLTNTCSLFVDTKNNGTEITV